MPPSPLTEADRETAFRAVIWDSWIERLDPSMSTDATVRWLKTHPSYTVATTSGCDDGPYPAFARTVERGPRGAHVKVSGPAGPLREGTVSWNELANRSTHAALALRHTSREPVAGEQLRLGV